MIESHTIYFTLGFSSFVDAASSRQIAVVTLMLTQNLILQLLDHKNFFGVNDNYIFVVSCQAT